MANAFFPSTLTPGATQNDSATYTLGVRVESSVTQTSTGIRVYAPAAITGSSYAVWQDGVAQALVFADVDLAVGWNEFDFGSPVTLTGGQPYYFCFSKPSGSGNHYSELDGVTVPVVEGDFTSSNPGVYQPTVIPEGGLLTVAPHLGGTADAGRFTNAGPSWYGIEAVYTATDPGDTTAPSVPTNVSVDSITQASGVLTFTASTDDVAVTGYRYTLDGGSTFAAATSGMTLTGLTPATDYTIGVEASDAAGNWSEPGTFEFTTEAASGDTTAPTAPTELASSAITSSGFTISWTASTDDVGVAGYEYSIDGGVSTHAASSPQAVADLTEGTEYTFEVRSYDAAGNRSEWASINVTTDTPDAPPTGGDAILWLKDENGVWHKVVGSETGGSTSSEPWVFSPEDFGAVGDGVADDTIPIATCFAAAVAAAPDNNGLAIVRFKSTIYLVATPATQTTYHHAQLPIPFVSAASGEKMVTFILQGPGDPASVLYWGQEAPYRPGGVTIRSTWAGTQSGLDASVIGGPATLSGAPQDTFQGSPIATYSNMQVVLDGVHVEVAENAALAAMDLRLVAQVHVKSALSSIPLTPNGTPALTASLPSNDWPYGLRMPTRGNNVRNQIDAYAAWGMGTCLDPGEHVQANYLAFQYSKNGLNILNGYARSHSIQISRLLCEYVSVWIEAAGQHSDTELVIDSLDGESDISFSKHIDDPNNTLFGKVNFWDVYRDAPVVTGASKLRIVSDHVPPGAATAPSVPATATPLLNPFWRDADVYVTGGTVTAIKIAGVTTGLTSGLVRVPSGQTVELEYTVAPMWGWVLG